MALMHISVDQSPRIENWTKNSAIAFSNGTQKVLIITSQLKREALALLLKRGKTEDTAKWMIFAAGIFLLVRDDLSKIQKITIDQDFDARTMNNLCHWLWQKIKRSKPRFALDDIDFRSIKRKNPAHYLAYGVYTGLIKPNQELRVKRRGLLDILK